MKTAPQFKKIQKLIPDNVTGNATGISVIIFILALSPDDFAI